MEDCVQHGAALTGQLITARAAEKAVAFSCNRFGVTIVIRKAQEEIRSLVFDVRNFIEETFVSLQAGKSSLSFLTSYSSYPISFSPTLSLTYRY